MFSLSVFNHNYLDLGAILGDTVARVQDPTQETLRCMWLSQVLKYIEPSVFLRPSSAALTLAPRAEPDTAVFDVLRRTKTRGKR